MGLKEFSKGGLCALSGAPARNPMVVERKANELDAPAIDTPYALSGATGGLAALTPAGDHFGLIL